MSHPKKRCFNCLNGKGLLEDQECYFAERCGSDYLHWTFDPDSPKNKFTRNDECAICARVECKGQVSLTPCLAFKDK